MILRNRVGAPYKHQMNSNKPRSQFEFRSGWPFWTAMSSMGVLYLAFVMWMVLADFRFASWTDIWDALQDPRVRFSISLSLQE